MPGVIKKDLHLAHSVGELNTMAGKLPAIANVKLCVTSAQKLFKNAEETHLLGDEEKAYVLYMKFFNFISAIKKTGDYKKNERYYKDLIGMKNLLRAMDEAEKLSSSLKNRYEEKEAEQVSKKLEELSMKKAEEERLKEKEDMKEKRVAPDELNMKTEARDVENVSSKFLSIKQLYSMLENNDDNVLVMDVRSTDDYAASHIRHTNCINVPADIVPPGATVNRIEQSLPEDSKDLWLRRALMDFIILVDWTGSDEDLKIKSTLNNLKDAIFKWDMTNIIKSEPLVLQGGYRDLLLFYPMLTTNAHVTIPKSDSSLTTGLPSLDTIDYDLDLNFLKSPEELAKEQEQLNSDKSNITRANELERGQNIDMRANDLDGGQNIGPFVPNVDRSNKPSFSSGSDNRNVTVPTNINKDKKTNIAKINNLEKMRQELMEGQKKLPVKDTNITNQGTVDIPKPAFPNVDRKLKPKSSVQNEESDSSSSDPVDSGSSSGISSRNGSTVSLEPMNLKDLEDSVEMHKLKHDNERLVLEHKARLSKLVKQRDEFAQLQEIKSQEMKETASLLAMKRKVQEEIKDLEDLLSARELRMAEDEEKWVEQQMKRHQLEKEPPPQSKEASGLPASGVSSGETSEKQTQQKQEQKAKTEDKAAQQQQAEQLRQQQLQRDKEENLRRQIEKELRSEMEEKSKKEREEALRKQEQERMLKEAKQREMKAIRDKEIQLQKEKEQKAMKQREEQAQKEKELQDKLRQEKEEKIRRQKEQQEKAEKERRLAEAERLAKQRDTRTSESGTAGNAQKSNLVTPGLRVGWEKKLDANTGRYYYVNHDTQKTQWEPPQLDVTPQSSPARTFKTRLKEEGEAPSGGGLKRSHSSPNIVKMMAEEEQSHRVMPLPQVDRANKPKPHPEVRPMVIKTEVSAAKVRNLQPIWGSMGHGLTGLKNLGNTCYMNSIIQCLSNTAPLTTYLLTDSYGLDINKENIFGKGGEVAEEFAVLVKSLWCAQYKSVSPRDFKMTVGKFHELFAGFSQQDSQEFLLFLMDGLHEDLNRVRRRKALPEQNNDDIPDEKAAETAWRLHKTVNESIIVELFQGQFKSTVRCLSCSKKSVTFDAFMYLTLPISASSGRTSLRECFLHFMREEKMTGESRWHCPRCKCPRDAVKQIVIWKLPPILLIHLKRFYYQGMWRQKITTSVDFPLTDLDMNNYLAGNHKRRPYSLYGVSNHYGSLDGGHYTAYCKNPSAKKWYKYDDHEVYDISSRDIQSSAAYILFYTCIEMSPVFK